MVDNIDELIIILFKFKCLDQHHILHHHQIDPQNQVHPSRVIQGIRSAYS